MGHIRLGNLARTREFQQVIDLLDSGVGTPEVAAATLDATARGLESVSRDPAFVHAFWLLTQLPLCARQEDFAADLNKVGINVSAKPSLFELVGGFADAVDAHVRLTGGRTDLGEIAQMGAAETLATILRDRSASLFGSTADSVRQELAGLATQKQFSVFARDFFARITEKYLVHFLSRRTSSQFKSVSANREFREALSLHCYQASKIVEAFAGAWYSKTNYEGGITSRKAGNFVAYALTKLRAELARGAAGDASL